MQVWLGRNGERFGPYTEDEVRQWLRDGTCGPDELGWHDGMTDWRPLGELFPGERPAAVPPGAVPPPPPPPPFLGVTDEAAPEYAGFWLRFGAWVIDYIVITVPSTFIAMAMGFQHAITTLFQQMETNQAAAMSAYLDEVRPISYIVLLIGFAYYVLCESSKWQGTLGKLAVGIRVTDTSGQRLTLGRAAGRNLIRLANAVPFLSVFLPMVFYVTAAFSERKQGIHDMLAGTYVLTGRADARVASAPRSGTSGTFDA
ncbi:RDD family protein [Luteibacter pinisoli]|uniref:RDD family protein n=1 Tax=Luteibacter pinisoli TaxID=2589080 RepID=A0A4Y5Z8F1_9GAMM|nr:RDD family protein [Luteibacter pinisoli]QDE41246.1 RDD family protein [Luteibacter pinisoli]